MMLAAADNGLWFLHTHRQAGLESLLALRSADPLLQVVSGSKGRYYARNASGGLWRVAVAANDDYLPAAVSLALSGESVDVAIAGSLGSVAGTARTKNSSSESWVSRT